MNVKNPTGEGELGNEINARTQDQKDAALAENQTESDAKQPSALTVALTEKFVAEKKFIDSPQTDKTKSETSKLEAEKEFIEIPQTQKTNAETLFLGVRKLEAEAEIKRLEVERDRLRADRDRLEVERLRLQAEVFRTEAERDERKANTVFTQGARTLRERSDARASNSIAFKNIASVLGSALGIVLQIALVAGLIYFSFTF